MEQLSDRIQWILENRLDPVTKRPWEAKALSVAAHLGSDAHVGMMRRGTVKKPTGETLAAIAKVAKVSLWWLATGEAETTLTEVSFRRQPRRVRTLGTPPLPGFPVSRPVRRLVRRLMRIDPHAREHVLHELRQDWTVDSRKLEGLADAAHAKAEPPFPFVPGLMLAVGNEFAVEDHHGCGCGISGLHPYILHVKRSADAQKYTLRILHELAHALLRQHYPEHTHADVWALTLMLAIPRSAYRRAELARHVARWVVALRQLVARRVSREAA